MKTKNTWAFLLLFTLSLLSFNECEAQGKPKFEGPRWRAGLGIQYASSFKNLRIDYATGYTGVLGGFSGRGIELFLGHKVHKYISIEVNAGLLLNSYNRSYDQSVYIVGRFNKFYLLPNVKFIYPILNRNFGTINLFIGGGVSLNGSGKLYLEERDYYNRYITFAQYDPMIAPVASFGAELLFNDRSNLLIGIKYQNGTFNANKYQDGYNPAATLKNAPNEIKTLNAQGIAIMLGFIQEF